MVVGKSKESRGDKWCRRDTNLQVPKSPKGSPSALLGLALLVKLTLTQSVGMKVKGNFSLAPLVTMWLFVEGMEGRTDLRFYF